MAVSPDLSIALTDMKLSEIQHFMAAVHEQAQADKFLDSLHNLEWTSLAMGGEAGEFANNVKKVRRDEIDLLTPSAHVNEHLAELRGELADTLSYMVVAASLLGISLADLLDLSVSRTTAWAEARDIDLVGIATKGGVLFKYVVPFHQAALDQAPPSIVPDDDDDDPRR